MKRIVSIGTQDFEKLRENSSFYIDKTDFIKEWWENQDDVTLITRPRRFGKTLNMSTLNCFFSLQYCDCGKLFDGLSIWKDSNYRKLQGTYPVIFLSFADIKLNTFEKARNSIIQKILQLYSEYNYIQESDKLNEKDKEFIRFVKSDMSDEIASIAIQNLTTYIGRYYGKKVLILLDEYDTPLQEAYVNGYWDKMAAFIRSLFNATFKTNPSMERAMLTGITRVSKQSIFSDLNNLEVVTTTSDKYATVFGFTEEEVCQALEEYGIGTKKEQVKIWYDGFTFGKYSDIYNPWSITKYLDSGECKQYWSNTSSNRLVADLLQKSNVQVKIAMEKLLSGGRLETELDEEIIFDQLGRKRNAIWSFLLACGYLKVENVDFSYKTGRYTYTLSLTNREVELMFCDMVSDWFSADEIPYNEFVQALLEEDIRAMNRYMNRVALHTFSYFDTGRKPSTEQEPERFYHGFVLGLMVELAGTYQITSNRESGYGRYDVMLKPLEKGKNAYVLEFKVHDSENGEETLEDTVRAALNQIEEKEYDSVLMGQGIKKDQIRHYGFAFEGKKVLIGNNDCLFNHSVGTE